MLQTLACAASATIPPDVARSRKKRDSVRPRRAGLAARRWRCAGKHRLIVGGHGPPTARACRPRFIVHARERYWRNPRAHRGIPPQDVLRLIRQSTRHARRGMCGALDKNGTGATVSEPRIQRSACTAAQGAVLGQSRRGAVRQRAAATGNWRQRRKLVISAPWSAQHENVRRLRPAE